MRDRRGTTVSTLRQGKSQAAQGPFLRGGSVCLPWLNKGTGINAALLNLKDQTESVLVTLRFCYLDEDNTSPENYFNLKVVSTCSGSLRESFVLIEI